MGGCLNTLAPTLEIVVKIPVVQRSEYEILFEGKSSPGGLMTFVSFELFNVFSRRMKDSLCTDISTLAFLRDEPLFAMADIDDLSTAKFYRGLGFFYHQPVWCSGKTQRDVFIYEV